ncbi:zinc finger CCCH domain-containing protein 20 [Heracleum sosnowskyi]|uniref:Zinc finger CCCH domain-containing protein 20 n=1 Tax=Heracleum sosnowskyi TaxID=360622 RepID=A0AAD8MIW2_9APIA|nr:zinc finger CCCH domain-containing protein 20 [Heracleum sosnowskyi]
MMIGERARHSNPTVHVPPWSFSDNPTADISLSHSPNTNPNFFENDYSFFLKNNSLANLRRYIQSNLVVDDENDVSDDENDLTLDTYACDNFRMYEFKVRKCVRGRSHDWTECPYAHPGEKARRRDPRKFHYSGTACPDFRKGNCKKGDVCEFAHGVFECWLHPARYRTQVCKDGQGCRRRVCFFAHTPEEVRVLSPRASCLSDREHSYDGSPRRLCFEGECSPNESPPMSPMAAAAAVNSLSRSLGSSSIGEMVASLRQLQLNKVKSIPTSWALQMSNGGGSSGLGSPGSPLTRVGFSSLPSTPTRPVTRPRSGYGDFWEKMKLEEEVEEEPVMERVESGRGLRAKMFEKLSKENPLDRVDPNPSNAPNPDLDLGWVSDLVK